ncbi:disulfide bond formation protein DsbB [Rheinheimera tilapiae]|jgi:disulfide bond formation protein DsbB|uniref:Disulfide bond formation protein B n=1 Tax=Rheinheimera tilapiae TaxID=875043 RepID=A0ABV6BBL2_9GAMM
MFAAVSRLPFKAWPWLLMSAFAGALLITALYFQYVMGLAPCIMCVYQRFAIVGILLSGLVGAFGCQYSLVRWLAYTGWLLSSGWGLKIAHDQVLEEQLVLSGGFSSCGIFPDFPTWLPLHEWIPEVFKPTGMCGEILWTLFGYSMPFWMRITFALFFIAGLVVIASQLKKHKYNPYD